MYISGLILPDNAKLGARLTAILWVLTLLGCQPERPATPMCRTASDTVSVVPPSGANAAVCLIRIRSKVLMIRHRSSGLLALPSAARTGRESLRCAAHRATWEQTGFNVEVGQLLTHTNTGNPVFDCRGEASLADLPTSFEAPRWANSDIAEIVSVRPFELNQAHLHDRENFIPLRDAFVLAQSKNE